MIPMIVTFRDGRNGVNFEVQDDATPQDVINTVEQMGVKGADIRGIYERCPVSLRVGDKWPKLLVKMCRQIGSTHSKKTVTVCAGNWQSAYAAAEEENPGWLAEREF